MTRALLILLVAGSVATAGELTTIPRVEANVPGVRPIAVVKAVTVNAGMVDALWRGEVARNAPVVIPPRPVLASVVPMTAPSPLRTTLVMVAPEGNTAQVGSLPEQTKMHGFDLLMSVPQVNYPEGGHHGLWSPLGDAKDSLRDAILGQRKTFMSNPDPWDYSSWTRSVRKQYDSYRAAFEKVQSRREQHKWKRDRQSF